MSASDWPRADPALERHYRRLLRAYPRLYRRRHGAEIVTTLLEMAEPGQQRPGLADSWHLVAAGIRQRFRLPRRPLAWLGAVLALVAGAALGAAAGSWTAWQTYTPLPGPEQATAIHQQATAIHQQAAGAPATDLRIGTYTGHYNTGGTVGTESTVSGWTTTLARQRFTADGWQALPQPSLDRGYHLMLVRDGLRLQVSTDVTRTVLFTYVTAVDNGWMRPLVTAGLLAGATAGWLIAAAVAQRRSPAAAVAAGFAVTVLAAPVWAIADNLRHLYHRAGQGATVHHALTSAHYWPAGPPWLNPALAAAGLALTAVTVALALRSRPSGPAVREVAS